jgi:hypothetical protein
MREETERQLKANDIHYDELIMMRRKGKEPLPKAVIYKEEVIQDFLEDIILAIDDRQEIVEMYQRYGIPTLLANFPL